MVRFQISCHKQYRCSEVPVRSQSGLTASLSLYTAFTTDSFLVVMSLHRTVSCLRKTLIIPLDPVNLHYVGTSQIGARPSCWHLCDYGAIWITSCNYNSFTAFRRSSTHRFLCHWRVSFLTAITLYPQRNYLEYIAGSGIPNVQILLHTVPKLWLDMLYFYNVWSLFFGLFLM